MDIKEIERELEIVDRGANSNVDMKHMAGLIARGVWQIALQLAEINQREDTRFDRGK